ncbi:MAG TPA: glucose-1-phosphate thymidylyltransferase [Firmicutes bacterium]|nr:glucose-1-phosphate thymidylyltransferase [Bacillota bacterium]
MKALLLCGGEGTRLRPFTHTRPKQLFPLANKAILFYILEYLASSPIREVVMITGTTGAQIRAAVGNGEKWGLHITYVEQPQPLGLAHTVLLAEEALGAEAFMMYLGDNLLEEPLSDIVQAFSRNYAAGRLDELVLVHEVKNPSQFGVAEIREDRVIKVIEKPEAPSSNLALAGIYFFSPEIYNSVRKISPSARGELEITDAIQDLINRGQTVGYRRLKGWWKDTGSPEELLSAQKLLLRQEKKEIRGELFRSHITGRIQLGANSIVENSRLKGPVCIGADCRIKDAVLGPFLSVGDRVEIDRAEVKKSILLPGCRVENLSLTDSILGERSRASAPRPASPEAPGFPHRLLLGDDSSVELQAKRAQKAGYD